MKIKLFFAIILVLIVGCKKNDSPAPLAVTTAQQPTSLEISVADNMDKMIEGASVKLYASYNDMTNHSNQIGETQTTDVNGKVSFSNLPPKQYYCWYAQKNGKSNKYEINSLYDTLTAHKKNIATTKLSSKCKIVITKFENHNQGSLVRIWLYIDGNVCVNGNYDTSPSISLIMPAGSHSIREVIDKEGCSFGSSDKTYTINLVCDSTFTFNP